MTPGTGTEEKTLDKVRKLLAKAEAEGTTPAEAELFTAKAAELMAKYGIEQAQVTSKDTTAQFIAANRIINIPNPWAHVRSGLLNGIAMAMRCKCVQVGNDGRPGVRVHVFGSKADIERAEMLYTSLLLQSASALRKAHVPAYTRSKRAWSRSFLLGYNSAVCARVRAAEGTAREDAKRADAASGSKSTELVLVSREAQIKAAVHEQYPRLTSRKVTYSGGGYGAGHAQGQRANLGGTGVTGGSGRSIGR
jgi:hypothetical protein